MRGSDAIGSRRGGRTGLVTAVAVLALLFLSFTGPTATSVVFPLCSESERLQVWVAFNDASAPSGAFTLAGCTHPFGYAVRIWFKSGTNPGYGKAVQGLPSSASPLLLQSRYTDGHFHETLILPARAPDKILVSALLANPYGGSESYSYTTEFLVRDPEFADSGTEGAYAVKNPMRTPELFPAWAPEGAPAGVFTLFGTLDANGAHVRVWFEDAQTGLALPGLYSEVAPWVGAVKGSRFSLSYVIPADLPVDFTQPNVRVTVLVLETGTTIEGTLWVHRMV